MNPREFIITKNTIETILHSLNISKDSLLDKMSSAGIAAIIETVEYIKLAEIELSYDKTI